MQKLARAVVGTNNIDNCSRYCQAPATTGLFRTVGYGGDSGSIADIEQADLVIIIGSNTAESHPVLATRVKSSHKLHGQKLIVSDLRENEMARRADLFLHAKPSTDLVWLNAVSRYLLDHGLANTAFLDQWVNGLDEYRKSLEPFTMEAASRICGLLGGDARSAWRTPIADAEAHVHSLGDGRDAAPSGIGHVDGDLESAARHRQLHAAGHRRLSAARAQQRAGRERQRLDAEHAARISVGGRSGRAGALRSVVGRDAADHQGPQQPPDGRGHPSRQAQGDVHDRRGDEHRRLERELRAARRSTSSSSSSCRTSSSATPAGSPTSCCRRLRASRRKARSRAPNGGFSGSTRCSSRSRDAGRTGRSSRMSPTSSARAGTISIRPRSWTRSRR